MASIYQEKFLVSPELLNYWYPHKKWRNGTDELFRPTHFIELVHNAEILASDLVCLEDSFAFPPQEKNVRGLPLYRCKDGVWWNYINEDVSWKNSVLYVQETEWTEDNSEIGWVYFIREGDYGNIKIGWSQNPKARLAALQTANSKVLQLLGTVPGHISEEKRLHKYFQRDRVYGEWFRNSNELEDFLNTI